MSTSQAFIAFIRALIVQHLLLLLGIYCMQRGLNLDSTVPMRGKFV